MRLLKNLLLHGAFWLLLMPLYSQDAPNQNFDHSSSDTASSKNIPYVLVTVAPYKFFVEKIANGTVQVLLMVPAGASGHTYEPNPKEMINASRADMWFQIGESFEPRATASLMSHNKAFETIDLRQGVDLIISKPGEEGYCHCCQNVHASCIDPHFWLSARQAQIQAATIASALSRRYPQHANLYQSNLYKFQEELKALDKELDTLLKPVKQRTMMVSHPAYAYFCRDYQLKQLSIEFEGKDPTPKKLTNILNKARALKINRVYIQPQYSNKGAKLIARQLNAEVITLDPYSEQYIESMKNIASHVAQQ